MNHLVQDPIPLLDTRRGRMPLHELLLDPPSLRSQALKDGRLGHLGLDVYEDEPTHRHALTAHPKVVATPHIGAQTREAQERIAIETAHMVLAALDGEVPAAAVNPSVRRPGA